jgi:hypothetical protein
MDRRTIESEIVELDRLIGEAENLLKYARSDCWRRGAFGHRIIPLARLASALERLFSDIRGRRDFLDVIKQLYR